MHSFRKPELSNMLRLKNEFVNKKLKELSLFLK